MSTAAVSTVPKKTGTNGCTGECKSIEAIMEAVFAFIFKGAHRVVQMNASEFGLLKRLGVEFTIAPEDKRAEILETMLEVLIPDDYVGGIAEIKPENREVRARVNSARKFIGQQICMRRKELGLSQTQLARQAKIPQSHVSRLEGGKHAPTRKTIEHIAKALRVTPSSIDPGYPEVRETEVT